MGSIASPSTFESSSQPVASPALQKRIRLSSQTSQLSLHPSNPTAVVVKNACKAYSNGVPVLDDFGMSVPSGAIYSLLGASGCGKTTMLSCIVGTLKLDSGDVFVFGQKPGTAGSGIPGRCIGYMPQGVTLYACLSIKETLEYFGRLYGMSNIEIQSRIEFLVNFLDLPSASQLVGTLSGGQQRRTSLAACLLHEPSLLILDEPTVGVDPLMRETIWSHLREITKKKQTTVIITTHYIEEAKCSQRVGLMRNGRLLIEDSPRALLREANATLLQDIVLQLCLKDEASINNKRTRRSFQIEDQDQDLPDLLYQNIVGGDLFDLNEIKYNLTEDEDSVVGLTFKERYKEFDQLSIQKSIHTSELETNFFEQFQKPIKFQDASWISKIMALFIRNMLIFIRNPKTLYLAFLAPAFHVVIVNTTLGPVPKNTHVGVILPEVNYDLNVCKNISWKLGCKSDFWSCNFIDLLETGSVIKAISFDSREAAIKSIEQGKTVGYMYFPKNFTRQLLYRFVAGRFAEEDTLLESNIEIRLDETNFFTSILLKFDLFKYFGIYTKELIHSCDLTSHQAELAFKYNAIYGTIGSKFEDYISPGILILISFIIPAATAGYALINDRNGGTLDRTMVAGATVLDILIAHFLSETLLILIQTAISYSVIIFVFQWEIKGSTMALLSLLILTAISGVSAGTCMVQTLGEMYEGIFLIMSYFIYNIFYTASPLGAQMVSWFFPCSWVIEAMRSLITRGWSVTHQNIWPGYAALIGTILVFWIATIKLWRVRI